MWKSALDQGLALDVSPTYIIFCLYRASTSGYSETDAEDSISGTQGDDGPQEDTSSDSKAEECKADSQRKPYQVSF